MSLLNLLFTVAISIAVTLSFVQALKHPEVHMTYPDMECVKIVGGSSNDSCDSLPLRHVIVWVAPRNAREQAYRPSKALSD